MVLTCGPHAVGDQQKKQLNGQSLLNKIARERKEIETNCKNEKWSEDPAW